MLVHIHGNVIFFWNGKTRGSWRPEPNSARNRARAIDNPQNWKGVGKDGRNGKTRPTSRDNRPLQRHISWCKGQPTSRFTPKSGCVTRKCTSVSYALALAALKYGWRRSLDERGLTNKRQPAARPAILTLSRIAFPAAETSRRRCYQNGGECRVCWGCYIGVKERCSHTVRMARSRLPQLRLPRSFTSALSGVCQCS